MSALDHHFFILDESEILGKWFYNIKITSTCEDGLDRHLDVIELLDRFLDVFLVALFQARYPNEGAFLLQCPGEDLFKGIDLVVVVIGLFFNLILKIFILFPRYTLDSVEDHFVLP